MTYMRISVFVILVNCLTSSASETSTSNFRLADGPPRLRSHSPSYYEVPVGDRCKLRCPVVPAKTTSVEWFRWSESDHPLNSSERIRIGRTTLTVLNVTHSDDGVYFCRASNQHGEVYNNFTLRVIEPYLLDEPEEEEIYREPGLNDEFPPRFASKMIGLLARPAGSSVVLKCNAHGNPAPTIEWLKNGDTPLREQDKEVTFKKYSLIMDHLTLYDSGKYMCIVSNELGNISHSFELEVQERIPHRPIFRDGFPANQTVRVGGSARFECRFVSDLQPRMVFLRHFSVNGSYSEPDSDQPYVLPLANEEGGDPHVLVLRNVTYEHAGFYTCLAGNSIGVSYRSAYLTVLPPEDEEEGVAVAMETVTSEPRPLTMPVVLAGAFIGFGILAVFAGWAVCRCRYRNEKPALKTSMVITKKIVLEKRDQEDETATTVPFVKIDYNMVVCSGDPSSRPPRPEYELDPDPEWEFPRDKLLLGHVLGEGAFGQVVKAETRSGDGVPHTVAVKMLKDNHLDSEMSVLVSEMELMKSMGRHVNVVSLQGVCSQGGPLYVIVEYCENGNLRDYLRTHRIAVNAVYDQGYEEPIGRNLQTKKLGYKNLLSFAYQTAKGMEYLATKKLVHRDLAARNLLLTDKHVIKIADFGLSRDIYNTDYYKKVSSSGRLPIKWMAPETLDERVYSSSSDCWSYGVVLWEIFTLGATPYPCVPHERLLDHLRQGHRMHKPDHCPREVYQLMRKCWSDVPKERPTWAEIAAILDPIMVNAMDRVYVELNFPVLSTPENSSSDEDT